MSMIDITPTKEEQKLIDIDDRIDSYLRGKMTTEEEKAFMQDCQTYPDLRERAFLTALLAKTFKQ